MTYPCHWFSEQVGLAGDLGSTNDTLIPLVEMDDPNITMEEYIELEAKKARRHDFPAIIYEDALASDHEISSKPMMKVRVRRKDADISSGIGLHVPRYTQLLAESYNEVEFYRQSVFPPTELPTVRRITLL
ncbi:hypothetical protein Tco_1134901 [Tanacetum coccineum]